MRIYRLLGLLPTLAALGTHLGCGPSEPSNDCTSFASKDQNACLTGAPMAGIITSANLEALSLSGPVVDGTVGDFFLRNNKILAVVQQPGRTFGPGPFGGNLIDLTAADSGVDVLGEALPLFQMGLTVDFDTVRVVNDGRNGEAAVIEAIGQDARWDFINFESTLPLLRYEEDERGNPISFIRFDTQGDLPLEVTARYILEPGADTLQVRYGIQNLDKQILPLRPGFVVDMRGRVEPFSPGSGWRDPGIRVDNINEALSQAMDQPYIAYQAEGFALTILSRDFLDGVSQPRMTLAATGIAIFMLGTKNLLNLFGEDAPMNIPAQGTTRMGFDIHVTRDVGEAQAWALGADETWGTLEGVVRADLEANTPIPEARIALVALADSPGNYTEGDIVNAFVSDAAGQYKARVPGGVYGVIADHGAYAADSLKRISIAAGATTTVSHVLGYNGEVEVKVQVEKASGELGAAPCTVTLLAPWPQRACGTQPCSEREPFWYKRKVERRAPNPYHVYLQRCDTNLDAPIKVVPGRYGAVVSRGPEFSYIAELIEVPPKGKATVEGSIRRVVDSDDLVASEYHIHQVHSPDATVTLKDRTLSLAAVGIDFAATADHDALSDLRPLVRSMNLGAEIVVVPGAEVSTSDLGHFCSFPIEPIAGKAFGGPPDWSGGNSRSPPEQLFDEIRLRGAEIVQVNHPRSGSGFFDKIPIRYTFNPLTGTAVFEPSDASFGPELFLMPPTASLLADNFDAIEVFNGVGDGDNLVALRDWFNFLSVGVHAAITADSDSHRLVDPQAGYPRTYVPISPADLRSNPSLYYQRLRDGRGFVSNGPILKVVARGAGNSIGFGETMVLGGEDLVIDVRAETAGWFEVTEVELFINKYYNDPEADVKAVQKNGARGYPTADFVAPLTVTASGNALQGQYNVSEARITLSAAQLTDLIGASEKDAWIVVRVKGSGSSLAPVLLRSAQVTFETVVGDSPGFVGAEFSSYIRISGGVRPSALGNPIYIDRDGNGKFDPPFTRD